MDMDPNESKTIVTWSLALGLLVTACEPLPEPEGQAPYCVEAAEDAEGSSLAPPDPEHPLGARLQSALEDAVDAGLPGVVMAIRDPDGVWEGSAGFADLGREIPMQTCHRTRIASVTKTFVAATVMRLVDRGQLQLDAPLTDYLPERGGRIPHGDQITLRHLLSHTSGVYNFLDVALVLELFNRPERVWPLDECFEHAVEGDAQFAPGEDWSYSNTNYLLLGWVIEAVSGKPHEEVMREELFEPLDLQETTYRVDQFEFPGVARGYFDLFGNHALVDSTQTYANTCVGPDGGMVSSAHDVLVFYDHLFAQEDLLEPDSLRAMLPFVATDQPDFPEYGLGVESWEGGERRGYGHGGQEFGYRTFAYYFPQQDLTFVVWFNASSLLPTEDNVAKTINAQRNRLRDIALRLR